MATDKKEVKLTEEMQILVNAIEEFGVSPIVILKIIKSLAVFGRDKLWGQVVCEIKAGKILFLRTIEEDRIDEAVTIKEDPTQITSKLGGQYV